MPGGDRTGPAGAGPMTGRGLGYCSGNAGPGYATAGSGMGRGFGRGGFGGRGMAWRRGWNGRGWQGMMPAYAPAPPVYPQPVQAPDSQQELDALRRQVTAMEQDLAAARARVAAMEQEPDEPEK